jgi:hypothetical protein
MTKVTVELEDLQSVLKYMSEVVIETDHSHPLIDAVDRMDDQVSIVILARDLKKEESRNKNWGHLAGYYWWSGNKK